MEQEQAVRAGREGAALRNQLAMHPHELCVPAAGCCLAAATLLHCFPSPAEGRTDALLELNGSCQRRALCWAGWELQGRAGAGAERGCPLLEPLGNGSALGEPCGALR